MTIFTFRPDSAKGQENTATGVETAAALPRFQKLRLNLYWFASDFSSRYGRMTGPQPR